MWLILVSDWRRKKAIGSSLSVGYSPVEDEDHTNVRQVLPASLFNVLVDRRQERVLNLPTKRCHRRRSTLKSHPSRVNKDFWKKAKEADLDGEVEDELLWDGNHVAEYH